MIQMTPIRGNLDTRLRSARGRQERREQIEIPTQISDVLVIHDPRNRLKHDLPVDWAWLFSDVEDPPTAQP